RTCGRPWLSPSWWPQVALWVWRCRLCSCCPSSAGHGPSPILKSVGSYTQALWRACLALRSGWRATTEARSPVLLIVLTGLVGPQRLTQVDRPATCPPRGVPSRGLRRRPSLSSRDGNRQADREDRDDDQDRIGNRVSAVVTDDSCSEDGDTDRRHDARPRVTKDEWNRRQDRADQGRHGH